MATIVWATPDIDAKLTYMARVSNPEGQAKNERPERLIKYLLKHGHYSPFEMVNVCMEITTTRDIARQILRHRSFTFQEFSQRYAKAALAEPKAARMQDKVNRQSSLECTDTALTEWWDAEQVRLLHTAEAAYQAALDKGIAKEVARVVLPEGLTTSVMYMNGTLRSWIFYLKQRLDPSTQLEHQLLAYKIDKALRTVAPLTMAAIDEVNA